MKMLPLLGCVPYESNAQNARVLTERWVLDAGYCPSCGAALTAASNNSRACDFVCRDCSQQFELKSKSSALGKKVVNGAFKALAERVAAANNPNLYLLQYAKASWEVQNFLIVPRYFFTRELIEQRRPLSMTARRAGWVGCNILIGQVPEAGRIYYVKNGQRVIKEKVMSQWENMQFLRKSGLAARGWLLDIIGCIEQLNKVDFLLEEIYSYEDKLKLKHPNNQHIKEKMRQQLQILRDNGFISFVGRGKYKLNTL